MSDANISTEDERRIPALVNEIPSEFLKNNFTPNSFSKAFICLLKAD